MGHQRLEWAKLVIANNMLEEELRKITLTNELTQEKLRESLLSGIVPNATDANDNIDKSTPTDANDNIEKSTPTSSQADTSKKIKVTTSKFIRPPSDSSSDEVDTRKNVLPRAKKSNNKSTPKRVVTKSPSKQTTNPTMKTCHVKLHKVQFKPSIKPKKNKKEIVLKLIKT